jgi:1-hydroxycarotenoid 3,4-desaturase
MAERHVVVVGAGIGGLCSALLLAAQGVRVTVLERATAPGGKMRQVLAGGQAMDAGPTVFTMRWIFEAILERAGTSVDAVLRTVPLSVLARHWWGPDQCMDLHADAARSQDAIGRLAGVAEAQRFARFCDEARRVYAALEGPYIRSARPTLLGLSRDLGLGGLGTLARLGPFMSMWRALARHFHDPRLQQLFGRYATYCGASPWQAPATLLLIAQVEMDGVWAVEGGMHAVARAFEQLAVSRGAQFHYGCEVDQVLVRQGRAVGVQTRQGERIEADAVLFNGDCAALADGLLGDAARRAVAPTRPTERSLSALTWLMHADTQGADLVRHNVFFDADYASEFADIFTHRRLPRQATVYVCAHDRLDGAPARPGPERLLALVNAPAAGDFRPAGRDDGTDPFSDAEIAQCEASRFALLRRSGLDLSPTAANSTLVTPREFHRLFPATGGALYGRASHGWMVSFKRPGAASRLPGLFLAGGSVHPGPGVPMAAMSGLQAAEALMAHLDSTSRSSRVATSGGMSTPSATTANTG